MDNCEAHFRQAVFKPRALLAVGSSLIAALPVLYAYNVLGSFSVFHPWSSFVIIFSGLLTTLAYWIPVSLVLFCSLAYNITRYEAVQMRLRCPMDCLKSAASPKSIFTAAINALTSFIIAWMITNMIGGRYEQLIVNCVQPSNRYCINEFKWFIMVVAFLTGAIYTVETFAFGENSLSFPSKEVPVVKTLRATFPMILKSSTRAARRLLMIFYPLYALFGGIDSWLVSTLMFISTEEQAGLSSWWAFLDLPLLFHSYITAVLVRLIYSIADVIVHSYQTRHVNFALTEEKTENSLISAMELKSDNLVKLLAYKDLARIATKFDDERRSRVFSLSLPGGHPKIWNAVCNNTMAVLNEMLDRIIIQSDSLTAANKIINPQQAPKIETIKPGFVSNKTVPEKASQARAWYKPAVLYAEFYDYLAASVFSDSQKHIWALQALTALATRSYNEDKYGIVQQNLGEIIGLLIKLNDTNEKLFRTAPLLGRKPEYNDVNRASHELALEFRACLKASIESISETFGSHLNHIPGLSSDQIKKVQSL